MTKINTFTLKGIEIDILFNNGFLGYTFTLKGKTYGQKVKIKSRKVADITAATFLLIENALSTYENLTNENK